MTIDSVEGHGPEEIRAVPLRHPGRWVATAVMLVLAAMFVHDVTTNPRFGWGVVGSSFFSSPVVSGVEKTLELTFIAMVVGVVLGVIFAVMRLSPNPILSGAHGSTSGSSEVLRSTCSSSSGTRSPPSSRPSASAYRSGLSSCI